MTTEEFNGHLMAALHGPSAGEIVQRMMAVAVTDPASAAVIGEAISELVDAALTGAGLTDLSNAVTELAMLGHMDGVVNKASRLSPRDIIDAVEFREVMRKRVTDRLVKTMNSMSNVEEVRTVAARLHVTLDPKEPST